MRSITEKIRIQATKVDCDPKKDTDLWVWLTAQAAALVRDHDDKHCWLLAHCEDGVIWGELRDNGKLYLSCKAFPALNPNLNLQWETLQQARLFGESGELRLWRGPQDWQAHVVREVAGGEQEGYIEEQHLLWGYAPRAGETLPRNDGFVQITEGAQGIIHAPPLGDATPTEMQRAALKVRHYLAEDEAGVLRVAASRLVTLIAPGGK